HVGHEVVYDGGDGRLAPQALVEGLARHHVALARLTARHPRAPAEGCHQREPHQSLSHLLLLSPGPPQFAVSRSVLSTTPALAGARSRPHTRALPQLPCFR